jgi:hypothetical protein
MLKSIHVTSLEDNVLNVAVHVKYGEISDITLDDEDRTRIREVTEIQERFIQLVRDEGMIFLNKIVVHNGEPATIELLGELKGLKYRIKRKI